MVDEQIILTAERLRDDITEFRRLLRNKYSQTSRQVTGDEERKRAARIAEIWLVELATNEGVGAAIDGSILADLNVHFQRVLTFSEHATTRSRYDAELRAILDNYSLKIVVPLKQSRGRAVTLLQPSPAILTGVNSVFVGQSFDAADKRVNQLVHDLLSALGLRVVTGEKPKAEQISEKVKTLIEDQSTFVGIFTRRDKIARKREWTTSPWVIDEKAYALGRRKRLILIKEQGVGSIGGIQGDYEYIEFNRDSLELMAIRVIELFELKNMGLRK